MRGPNWGHPARICQLVIRMNFSRPGWFEQYLAFRQAQPFPHQLPSEGVRLLSGGGVHHEQDQAIYYFLQPTGLMYGLPVGWPFPNMSYPQSQYFDATARVHVILLESLFACLIADRHYLLEGLHDEPDHLGPAASAVSYYYLSDPFAPYAGWLWYLPRIPVLRRWQNRQRMLEREVTGRITTGANLFNLPEYAFNSFMFLDVYFCVLWQRRLLMEPARRHQHLVELRAEQEQLREVMLRLIIVAAHSSGAVDANEMRIFDRFLLSSRLPAASRKVLRQQMRTGITLEQMQIPDMPWLVRRYMLELTVMIILADRLVEEAEQQFIDKLVERLGLWHEELEQSQGALEVFLLNNESRLHFFHARTKAMVLADRIRDRAANAMHRNLDRIVNEVRETRELYALLMQSASRTLSAEEKQKVRAQLFDIMKTIPSLAIFALPGGSIALPILIKLLPFNLLPSSFED